MHRWVIALALVGGITAGTCASVSAATAPAFTVRNATHGPIRNPRDRLFGGAKIKLPPREMTVRTGNEGRIIIDDLANGEDGETLHFVVNVVSAA